MQHMRCSALIAADIRQHIEHIRSGDYPEVAAPGEPYCPASCADKGGSFRAFHLPVMK